MTQCYSAKPHAVTAAFSNTYAYDANGNQVLRRIAPYTHTLTYDAQGRMTGVSAVRDPVTTTITDTSRLTHTLYLPLVSNGATAIVTAATYLYDADGMRVKGEVGSVTTIYIAGVYEWQAGATTKYYDGGAMRRSSYASGNGIFYILKDHLGSTSVIVSQEGVMQATNYYYPYGANRGNIFADLTTKRFTGQYHESGLAGAEGLSFYNARWYDTHIGRFTQADTIVPQFSIPQYLNRFSYAANSPINRVDPSGHGDCNVHTTSGCMPWQKADEKVRSLHYPTAKKRQTILSRGRELQNAKYLTSMEKFAGLVAYASDLYDEDDADNFMLDISYVILGWSRSTGMVNPNIRGDDTDWLGLDAFSDWGGWSSAYSDIASIKGGQNNQMFHFWFYVAVSYFDGPSVASDANFIHETSIYKETLVGAILYSINPLLVNDGEGVSAQDYELGERGIELGYGLNYYAHLNLMPPIYRPLKPSEVADWLRTNLGEKKYP